jgi:hypothetical protein
MTAHIFEGLDFYFSSEYLTSLNSDMNYQTRDLSEAFRDDGTLDFDLANDLPYTNESLSLSMLNVNIGVRISIGGNANKRRSNPLYKRNGNSDTNPMYEGLRFQPNMDGISGETLATDKKSSRSNRKSGSSKTTAKNSTQTSDSLAQDYNLRRSNNSSILAPDSDESDTRLDSESRPADEATLVDIPEEKLKLKTKAQLAKERRKRKRVERRLRRLKAKL